MTADATDSPGATASAVDRPSVDERLGPGTDPADVIADTGPGASATAIATPIGTPVGTPIVTPAPAKPDGDSRGVRAVRGAALTAIANGVLPISSILTGPLLARALLPEGRGEMAAVLAPLFVANFIAATGLPDAATYAVARLRVPLPRVLRTSAGILIPVGAVATAAIWFGAPYIEHSTPGAVTDLRIASLSLPLLMYALVQRQAAVGAGRYGQVSVERTTAATVRLVLIVALVALGAMTAPRAVWCNIVGNLVAAWLLLSMVRRSFRKKTTSTPRRPAEPSQDPIVRGEPDLRGRKLAGRLWGYGLRGWGGVFANLVNWRLDQAILPAVAGPIQIGYYAVAVSLAEVPSMIIGATRQVVFTETSRDVDMRIAARATRIVILLSLVVDLLLALGASFIVPLLFGNSFAPAVTMTRILLIANIPWTAELVLATGLLSAGRPGLRSVGQVVAAVMTVAGLAILVPRYGAIGAAWTSLIAYTTNYVMTQVFFQRQSGLPLHLSLIPRPSDVRYLARVSGRAVRALRRRSPVST